MKKNIVYTLHRLFLFLSVAYSGVAVSLFIIFGPFQTEIFGHKISFTSLINPIRISLGLFILSFIIWVSGTEKGRSAFTGLLKKGWSIFQTGGLTSTNRIYWIDNLRTLAILLVVFGHTNNTEAEIGNVVTYIYSFHMPLFFFISGLTFYPERYKRPKEFLFKKISTLLVPYCFFSLLGFGLFMITNHSYFSLPVIGDSLFRIAFADTDLLNFGYDGPLWFLPCLFLVEVELYFISYLKKKAQIGAIGLLVVLGFIVGPKFRYIPWTAAGSFVALLFCWLGFLLKDKITSLDHSSKLGIILGGITVSLLFCYLNGGVSMAIDAYGNPLYFLLSALGGISYVVLLTTHTRPNRMMRYIGMNSIIIFGLHGHLLFFVIPKIKAWVNLTPLYALIPLTGFDRLNPLIVVLNNFSISLLLTLAQVGFLCLLAPIFNKKLYFLLGRKKPKVTVSEEIPLAVTPAPPMAG